MSDVDLYERNYNQIVIFTVLQSYWCTGIRDIVPIVLCYSCIVFILDHKWEILE